MKSQDNKNLVIAVIGKSAAGKSAFIKSFFRNPELISSEGRGQTTRTYLEYTFRVSKEEFDPYISAKFMSKSEFTDRRVEQVLENLENASYSVKTDGIIELQNKFMESLVYQDDVENIILHSKDFFDIDEFYFLENNLSEMYNEYDEFKSCILNYLNYEQGEINSNYYYKTLVNNIDKSIFDKNGEYYKLSELLRIWFDKVYDILMNKIKQNVLVNSFLLDDGIRNIARFTIEERTKDLLALFLRVVNEGKRKKSFTGLLNGIKIYTNICNDYYDAIHELEVEEAVLLDTFGLDHSSPEDSKNLTERYNRIFGIDYPNINTVFFIEAFHSGASTSFAQAINILYSQRPDIMTYIIGTHIDENEITNEDEMWLCELEKKRDNIPSFNGNVMDVLYGLRIVTTLMHSNISESMARTRCGVMQKRFAPFCGKLENLDSEHKLDFFRDMNIISIKTLFYSIVNEEHLGDRYINIDTIYNEVENLNWNAILHIFVSNLTVGFKDVFNRTYSRTRGKLKKNLKNYILGFDGSTIDTTWYRVFKDAYIQTFSKQISVDNNSKYTISQGMGFDGNSRIAVDELINKLMYTIFRRYCNRFKERVVNYEMNCSRCFKSEVEEIDCLWYLFIKAAGKEKFTQDYTPVIDWLNNLHDFEVKGNDQFYLDLKTLFVKFLKEDFVRLCRSHNLKLIKRDLKSNKGTFKDAIEKVELYINTYDITYSFNEGIKTIKNIY